MVLEDAYLSYCSGEVICSRGRCHSRKGRVICLKEGWGGEVSVRDMGLLSGLEGLRVVRVRALDSWYWKLRERNTRPYVVAYSI